MRLIDPETGRAVSFTLTHDASFVGTRLDPGPGCLMDYYEWFQKARHGEALVYWTGDLRFDRDPDNCPPDQLGAREPAIRALDQLAQRIWKDAADGALVLVQKRLGDNVFEYRALRRRRDETGATVPSPRRRQRDRV